MPVETRKAREREAREREAREREARAKRGREEKSNESNESDESGVPKRKKKKVRFTPTPQPETRGSVPKSAAEQIARGGLGNVFGAGSRETSTRPNEVEPLTDTSPMADHSRQRDHEEEILLRRQQIGSITSADIEDARRHYLGNATRRIEDPNASERVKEDYRIAHRRWESALQGLELLPQRPEVGVRFIEGFLTSEAEPNSPNWVRRKFFEGILKRKNASDGSRIASPSKTQESRIRYQYMDPDERKAIDKIENRLNEISSEIKKPGMPKENVEKYQAILKHYEEALKIITDTNAKDQINGNKFVQRILPYVSDLRDIADNGFSASHKENPLLAKKYRTLHQLCSRLAYREHVKIEGPELVLHALEIRALLNEIEPQDDDARNMRSSLNECYEEAKKS